MWAELAGEILRSKANSGVFRDPLVPGALAFELAGHAAYGGSSVTGRGRGPPGKLPPADQVSRKIV
jgi:hypothetical protein